jgi:DNA processing protein
MRREVDHASGIRSWLRLRGAEGVGPATFKRLLKHFGTPEQALRAGPGSLAQIEGIGPVKAGKIAASRNRFDADQEIARADREGIAILHLQDSRYPVTLKRIYDPPPILYVRGQLRREHALAVALVGSRRCSLYGQEQSARLAYQLGAAGFTVVSGMARGIDTAAHQGALSAGAETLAVQGCGLSHIFPPENKRLFNMIAAQGACLSECPLACEPRPQNFPARNRIIAGLALGTVIVEASFRSGALITARCALDQNREVLAVPGPIDSPLSQGPHRLLRQGATLVTCAQDIVTTLGQVGTQLQNHVEQSLQQSRSTDTDTRRTCIQNLSPEEQLVITALADAALHTDQLVSRTNLPAGRITALLVGLQLKGLVRGAPGNLFTRRR